MSDSERQVDTYTVTFNVPLDSDYCVTLEATPLDATEKLTATYDKSKVPAADANGNISFKDAAVKIGAAYYDENGNLVFHSMLDACSYSELTRKGYEQYMKNRSTSERLISNLGRVTAM